MSGTAKDAERAQALRKRAAEGDKAAQEELTQGEYRPDSSADQAHDVDNDTPAGT